MFYNPDTALRDTRNAHAARLSNAATVLRRHADVFGHHGFDAVDLADYITAPLYNAGYSIEVAMPTFAQRVDNIAQALIADSDPDGIVLLEALVEVCRAVSGAR